MNGSFAARYEKKGAERVARIITVKLNNAVCGSLFFISYSLLNAEYVNGGSPWGEGGGGQTSATNELRKTNARKFPFGNILSGRPRE